MRLKQICDLLLIGIRRIDKNLQLSYDDVTPYYLCNLHGFVLSKLTIGIVGMGKIGSAIVKCLVGFNSRNIQIYLQNRINSQEEKIMNTKSIIDNFNPAESYYQKDSVDRDSWFHVTQIDYEKLIEKYAFDNLFNGFEQTQLNLLDIGCGTAKFPSLVDRAIVGDIHCSVDLLDISEYCLQVAQKEYDDLKHFCTDKMYLSATENIHKSVQGSRRYDIIWAIHSLYTIDKNQMKNVYTHCLELLKYNGKFLIYQLAQNSFYYKLYDFYISHYHQPNTTTRILTSEHQKQILDVLEISYKTIKLHFTHSINANLQNILELYLEGCILDNTLLDVVKFFRPILQDNFDEYNNQYKFDQVVDLFIIEKASNIRK